MADTSLPDREIEDLILNAKQAMRLAGRRGETVRLDVLRWWVTSGDVIGGDIRRLSEKRTVGADDFRGNARSMVEWLDRLDVQCYVHRPTRPPSGNRDELRLMADLRPEHADKLTSLEESLAVGV